MTDNMTDKQMAGRLRYLRRERERLTARLHWRSECFQIALHQITLQRSPALLPGLPPVPAMCERSLPKKSGSRLVRQARF